jgi:hypothetical protein
MGTLPEGVSTSSVSRFLNNQLFRWESFLALLSKAMYIFIDGLTGKDRKKALVADDSDYDRTIRSREKIGGGKKNSKKKKEKKEKKNKGRRTEFAARKYDHARKRHSIGFRMLTLGFTDGFTFIPLCFSLLSSRRDDCVVGDKDTKGLDKRGFAYKRRKLARSATMDVLVTLVKRALAYVKSVRHICVDRWFSSPAQIVALRDATGLHVITVLKHGNAKFEFNGVEMTIKQIFDQVKKNKGRSRYLSEALIKIVKNGVTIKVVFVRNRANRKEWIAIATTDTSLAPEDIIEYYALRWDILCEPWYYANALGFQWLASFIGFPKGSHKIIATATVPWQGSPRCPKRAVHCREASQFALLQFLCERNPASHVLNCVSLSSKDQDLGRHGMLPNCLVTGTPPACFA